MTTRRFLMGSDHEQMTSWLNDRGMTAIPKDHLPLVGFIVEDVACGFLYKTDSCVGILDCFVSNPNADAVQRSKAFDHIMTLLLAHAKVSHLKLIKADAHNDNIKVLALTHGLEFKGDYSSFAKEI